jgi:hydroxymethylbilane synthase
MHDSVILGTRASALALWQAHHVKARLEAAGHAVDVQEVTTTGDRILDTPLAEIGDKGLFTKELDLALLEGRIHLAVHSLKDLPTTLPAGITIAAVSERAAPWDAFVAHPSFDETLADLPEGATLATSSLRRKAQLLAWRPDLQVVPVRGNVDTRLRKLDESDWHGLILAVAGLERLGLDDRIRERVPFEVMIPAVSQGALGIVCSETDKPTRQLLRETIHHEPAGTVVTAERAFLRRLEGGCSAPIGAHARFQNGVLRLDGCVASVDGQRLVRGHRTGSSGEADALGLTLANDLLERGAGAILDAIRDASA